MREIHSQRYLMGGVPVQSAATGGAWCRTCGGSHAKHATHALYKAPLSISAHHD